MTEYLKDNVGELLLREHTEHALKKYLSHLEGHPPLNLYNLVIHEVEEPLFRIILKHTSGNQTRAASILGINRATLRRKLREFHLI